MPEGGLDFAFAVANEHGPGVALGMLVGVNESTFQECQRTGQNILGKDRHIGPISKIATEGAKEYRCEHCNSWYS